MERLEVGALCNTLGICEVGEVGVLCSTPGFFLSRSLLCRDAAPEPAAGMERLEVGAEAVVDVAPLAGRLVLFLAGAVEHAVLPCQAERIALTAWCQ